MKHTAFRLTAPLVVLSLIIAACGSSTNHHAKAVAAAATQSTATTTTTPAPKPDVDPHLRFLAPRNRAHVGQSMTVHVSLTGAKATGSHAFKYVLDGKLTRLGPARLTYAGLAPGTHRLLVSLVAQPSVRAVVAFTVKAPPAPPPAPTTTTTAPPTPAPTTTAPAPNPPPPTTATPPPSPPPPKSCIPQHGGGDGDGDNHGAPSDGDGCI